MAERREEKWVEQIRDLLNEHFKGTEQPRLHAATQVKLPYGIMISEFKIKENPKENGKLTLIFDDKSESAKNDTYTTDLLIYEDSPNNAGNIIPRVVIEAKIEDASTHDMITYARKAVMHRALMPFLRYGIMIGAHKSDVLTWKHFAHGTDFDFMFSFKAEDPDENEREDFIEIVDSEIKSSQNLEKMFSSKNQKLDIYGVHRNLDVYPKPTKK
ncbi:MAG: hypothetical protein K2I74_05140 [Treponemataceae bacterium]|nr:hypothetical protein [Treponemataceae bacterium]